MLRYHGGMTWENLSWVSYISECSCYELMSNCHFTA